MIKTLFFIWGFTIAYLITPAQIITITPSSPILSDSITVVYDAKQGNGALGSYTGNVYVHTGLITTQSVSGSDWKNTVGNWGVADPKVLMTSLGDGKYSIRYKIDSFYNILPTQIVLKLAFVFRNASGTIAGKTIDNQDIFYDLNTTSMIGAGNYQQYSIEGSKVVIQTDRGKVVLTHYNPNVFKVNYFSGNTPYYDTSYSVVLPPQGQFQVVAEDSVQLLLASDSTQIIVHKKPVRIEVPGKIKELNGLYPNGSKTNASFSVDMPEGFYGTGSRAVDLNLKGRQLAFYNQASYGYTSGVQNLNISVPFILSDKNYGLYFDNFSNSSIDIGYTNSTVLNFVSDTFQLSYFIITGRNKSAVLHNYGLLTGFQPLPPKWSLGYIQSKYGYQTQVEADAIVNSLQAESFPLDALVLDLYWFGTMNKMGNLNWDYTKWPTPVNMMQGFKSKGVHTVLIQEPYFTTAGTNYAAGNSLGNFAKTSTNSSYVISSFWAGAASLLDMYKPAAQQWHWNLIKPRIDEGVDGWWCDLGEPENHPADMFHINGKSAYYHNLYSFFWSELLKKKYDSIYPQKRLFNLSRSGFAGSQRFGAISWSGDIQRSWSGLQSQIPLMLNSSLSGFCYMHSDAGGFTGGVKNDELYTRWLQFASFSPILRPHGEGVPTEPINYTVSTKNIVRNFVNLRYQWMPYLYTMVYLNSTIGLPLVKPMNFYDSANTAINDINTQYFWGNDMIVAPVTSAGLSSRSVYLPTGKWFNYFSQTFYNGGANVTVSTPISQMPVFIKAGSFIPRQKVKSATTFMKLDSIWVDYYADTSVSSGSEGLVYDDDGIDPAALQSKKYELIHFKNIRFGNDNTIIQIFKDTTTYSAAIYPKIVEFKIYGLDSSFERVFSNNFRLMEMQSADSFALKSGVYYFDSVAKILYVKVVWNGENTYIHASNIVNVCCEKSLSLVTLEEKLVEKTLTALLYNLGFDLCTITISDSSRNTVIMTPVLLTEGYQEFKPDISHLNPGLYEIKLSTGKVNIIAEFEVQ